MYVSEVRVFEYCVMTVGLNIVQSNDCVLESCVRDTCVHEYCVITVRLILCSDGLTSALLVVVLDKRK
jgi:hypothetical protein